jgi:hypothetical protein
MDFHVEQDLKRIMDALTRVKAGLDAPMTIMPESSDRERIAALANAVTSLAQVVTKIATSSKKYQP